MQAGPTMNPSSALPSAVSHSRIASELAPGERWFVVQTLAKRERRAEAQLAQQGFNVFLPMVMRSVRHARKVRNVKTAAFPGYLFVAIDVQRDRWRSINGTFGVARLITGEGRPLPVPGGLVESLMEYLDESGLCRFDRDLVVGQSVRVVAGPLSQALGKLVRLDANGRVRVLLEILGGQIQATIDRSALEAA